MLFRSEFIAYIEGLFADWMNWENNGRVDPNKRTWQLDHILPRSKFVYTSMDDTEFSKCWALTNLRPIEAVMNVIKSDRDFMVRCARSFRAGINEPNKATFIWDYLPYSPEEARIHLEKKYGESIDWDKFKRSKLHVDHIIPQAYLGFTSFDDTNFLECWKLSNLDIKLNSDNCAKGSLYEGKIWFYNKN